MRVRGAVRRLVVEKDVAGIDGAARNTDLERCIERLCSCRIIEQRVVPPCVVNQPSDLDAKRSVSAKCESNARAHARGAWVMRRMCGLMTAQRIRCLLAQLGQPFPDLSFREWSLEVRTRRSDPGEMALEANDAPVLQAHRLDQREGRSRSQQDPALLAQLGGFAPGR